MTSQFVLTMGRDALTLLLTISLPVLGVVMAVGLVVSIFQAVTQIHEATLAFVPKLVAAVVVFTIAGMSPGGTAYTILASAAITTTGLTVLRVHPELTAATNTIAKDVLPAALKITATHGDADSITYSMHFVGVSD